MSKLRILVAAFALAAVAPAFAADVTSGEWNTKYGMIFEVYNPLVNASFLKDYKGGIGGQYNLDGKTAIRGTVHVFRNSDPSYDESTTTLNTGVKTKTFDAPGDTNVGIEVGAAYIMRLGSAPLAPYLGAGARLTFDQTTNNWKDTISSTVITTSRDYTSRTFGLGAAGLAGLEWRIHPVISIFAEYSVKLELVDYTSSTDQNKTVTNATGAVTGAKVERSRTRFLQLDTGLEQGALLGLIAHF